MNDQVFKTLEEMLNNVNSNYNHDINFNEFNKSNNYTNNNNNNTNSNFHFSNIDMETILKIKNIMNKINSPENSKRSNLLKSLEPYLNPSRKEKLDQYIQFINIASILESFNKAGDI